jgi:hypothetical protein
VLSTAYSRAVAARSARMNLNVSVTLPSKQTTLTGSGAYDWGQRLGQLTLQAPVGGQTATLTEILDGSSVYIQLPPTAAAQAGKPWVRVDLSGLSQSGATSDPSQTLAVLEGSSDSVTDLGRQVIGGVQTTHYRAQVDPSKAAASAPAAARQALSQLPTLTGGSTIPVDTWIDAQGLPRQISYTVTLRQPPAGSPPAAAQAFPETTAATMDLSDYGVPVSVAPPPPDQVATQSLPGFSSGSASSTTAPAAGGSA